MRISEITDAQGQLELLRTVIDNTWSAIAQQAEKERKAEVARKANVKPKSRTTKGAKVLPKISSSPLPTLRTPPTLPPPNQQASSAKAINPNVVDSENSQPLSNPLPKQQFTSNAIGSKTLTKPQPKPISNAPKNALYGMKQGYLGKDRTAIEKDDDGDDRHSENGSSRTKK